tara:strand:+ start:1675 stop:2313 length:639 start_codon:yes stop_codon:yes gene_type:complete
MAAMSETATREQRSVKIIPTLLPRLEMNLWCQDDDLKNIYKEHIEKHNDKLNQFHADSGFDLLNPTSRQFQPGSLSNKFGLGVKISLMQHAADYVRDPQNDSTGLQPVLRVQPLPYQLLPRSSTGAKTNLRLSNSVGVIDSGYRGELCALVDCFGDVHHQEHDADKVRLEKGNRNFQLVAYNGFPIHVNLVDNESDLGGSERGEGGFGSTGN